MNRPGGGQLYVSRPGGGQLYVSMPWEANYMCLGRGRPAVCD